MKPKIILFACSLFILLISIKGQVVNKEEASIIAKNWINIIIDQNGSWGSFEKASVGDIQEFTRNGNLLGYYCPVIPEGFIVMSIRKELAPVKAYSTDGFVDIELEEGISELLKDCMERIIRKIEAQFGSIETVQNQSLIEILEVNYSDEWQSIYKYSLGKFPMKMNIINSSDNYLEGNVLLTSDWHQAEPYNDQCPPMSCTHSCNSNTNAIVGCVATAGAQIARYWNWPPYGEGSPYNDLYDWVNMPDEFTGCSWNVTEVNATAELNAEIGQAVSMNYGCGSSGAYTSNMENVFEDHYRYSTACSRVDRNNYSAIDWFNRLKYQINQNRPVQYRIPNHSIVGDGWQEVGSPVVRQYHMNYGWTGSGADIWYTLDALNGGNPDEEFMLEFIYPAPALGPFIAGNYFKLLFPYRYVDQDCQGTQAIFYQGQNIQFLQEMKITGTSSSEFIKFYGSSVDISVLYSRGNTSRGIKILDGGITLRNGGTIYMY